YALPVPGDSLGALSPRAGHRRKSGRTAGELLAGSSALAQADSQSIREIQARSLVWNTAYNSRDSLTFYSLFDSLALVSSAGGQWIGGDLDRGRGHREVEYHGQVLADVAPGRQ